MSSSHCPQLPNEIWLEILSRLDYFGLKNCIRVNKAFKGLVNNRRFGARLYRSRNVIPENDRVERNRITLHPALDDIRSECETEIEDITFCQYEHDLHNGGRLMDSSVAREQATSPAVSFLRLQIHNYRAFQVKNKDGVTVLQVMEAMCKWFGKKDKDGGINRDRMGSYTGWHGFTSISVDQKGRLVIHSDGFDS